MSLKLASGSYDNTIRFWDPSNGNCNPQETIKLDSAPLCLDITDRKDKVVVGMYNSVKIFDVSKPKAPVRSFQHPLKGNVNAVGCFSKEDKLIYTACQDGGLRIFDMKAKSAIKEYKNNRSINCAALHPDQSSIVFGDEGGSVSRWDLYNQSQHKTTIESDFSIRTITMSESLERMAFGDNEGNINLYSEHLTKKNQKPIKVHDDYILKMKISPNNKYLATCSADKKIKLFKINMDNDNFSITEHKTLKGHLKWVWDCQFSCDQAYLISCSTDMTIKLWEVEKGQLVQNLKGHEKGVICLALNDIAE